MDPTDPTLELLEDIRREVRKTSEGVETMSRLVSQMHDGLAHTAEKVHDLPAAQTASAARLDAACADLALAVRELREELG